MSLPGVPTIWSDPLVPTIVASKRPHIGVAAAGLAAAPNTTAAKHRYCEHDGSSACRSPLHALPHRKPLLVAAVTKSADPTAKFSFLQGPGANRSGLVGSLVIDHGTGTERARRDALRYASFRRELMAGRGPKNWTLEVASLGKNSAAFAAWESLWRTSRCSRRRHEPRQSL